MKPAKVQTYIIWFDSDFLSTMEYRDFSESSSYIALFLRGPRRFKICYLGHLTKLQRTIIKFFGLDMGRKYVRLSLIHTQFACSFSISNKFSFVQNLWYICWHFLYEENWVNAPQNCLMLLSFSTHQLCQFQWLYVSLQLIHNFMLLRYRKFSWSMDFMDFNIIVGVV